MRPKNNLQIERLQMLPQGETSLLELGLQSAWQFLRRVSPDGFFSIGFVTPSALTSNDPLSLIPDELVSFAPSEFDRFCALLLKMNGSQEMKHVVFDRNSAGNSAPEVRADRVCRDHIAISCHSFSDEFPVERVQSEFWSDMLFPSRRPAGLPLPSTLWATSTGVSALWTLSEPVGISAIIELEDTITCVLENKDFKVWGGRFHQLPFTLDWTSALFTGGSPNSLVTPFPFQTTRPLACHSYYAFRWLVENADESLRDHDPN